jgi:hypothetical protein
MENHESTRPTMNPRRLGFSKRDLLVSAFVLLLLALATTLFVNLGLTVEPIEWVALYVMVGFISGLLFYLVDPFASQEFKWKGVVNLGGGAAIGASFMLLAKALTPAAPLVIDDQYYAAVLPVHGAVTIDGGARFKVLEIRSMSDNKLVEMFQGIVAVVNGEFGSNPPEAKNRAVLQSFIQEAQVNAGLESFKSQMEPLVDKFLKNERKDIDGAWKEITRDHLRQRCASNEFDDCLLTFNRIPYALYGVGSPGDVTLGVAFPGTIIRVGSVEYEIVAFANPRRKFSEEVGLRSTLFEGLVLQRRKSA